MKYSLSRDIYSDDQVKTEYYRIKDECRKGLLKYLDEALSSVELKENSDILDIGCGTGVPTLWIGGCTKSHITAVDPDKDATAWLKEKALKNHLGHRITVLNISFFELDYETPRFDLILAEGFLNVIGFEHGFPKIVSMLKNGGYLIIHDEFRDHEHKCDFIKTHSCTLVRSFYLNEDVWWNDYYLSLKKEIDSTNDLQLMNAFSSDLTEIEYFRKDPSLFRSVYYVVRKENPRGEESVIRREDLP